jgi:zeaxanthin glucosyltransferase
MAHIAMVVPVWVGHLNPMTTLGRELQRRGHRVSVLSFPDAAARVSRAGLEHVIVGAAVFPPGEWERRTRQLAVRTGLRAARFTIHWLVDISRVMLTELPAVLQQGRFDGLVMDQVCYGAEYAADSSGLPLTVACNALPVHLQPDIPPHSETWPWSPSIWARWRIWFVHRILLQFCRQLLHPLRDAEIARGHRFDLWHNGNEIPPSLAHVSQIPACLDFPRKYAPDHFHHTGPWHEANSTQNGSFDWNWLDGRPLIYASFGTLQNGLDHLYRLVLDACADLPMQVVLALGREGWDLPLRIPANTRVLGYAPQIALLKRASLAITHAGMNTTLEALAQGVPLVALPITNDQPGIAARIKYAGAGEWLPIRKLKPERLHAQIEHVFRESRYRQRAQACAAEIAKVDGLRFAADIIEQALLERRRVTRQSFNGAGR